MECISSGRKSDKGLLPDKGCGIRQDISLFRRYCAYKSLTGGQGNELLAGNLCSNGSCRVVIRRELDENGCILREAPRQTWVLFDLEVVVEVSEDGSVGFVYEDEMSTQILVFVFVDGTKGRWSRVDLLVVVWDLLVISLLGKMADILGEDVIEGFEILGSDGILGERDGDGELAVGIGSPEGVEVSIGSDGGHHFARRIDGGLEIPQFDDQTDIAVRGRRLCGRHRHTLEKERAGGAGHSLLALQRRQRQRQEQESVADLHRYRLDGYGPGRMWRSLGVRPHLRFQFFIELRHVIAIAGRRIRQEVLGRPETCSLSSTLAPTSRTHLSLGMAQRIDQRVRQYGSRCRASHFRSVFCQQMASDA